MGVGALASLLEHKKASAEERGSLDAWKEHLRAYLNGAGGIQGIRNAYPKYTFPQGEPLVRWTREDAPAGWAVRQGVEITRGTSGGHIAARA